MSEVKTQALFPKGDENGLIELARTMADELMGQRTGGPPPKVRAALCIFAPLRATVEDGADIVTIKVHRIEVLLDQDLEEARKFIMRSLQARAGNEPLSLDFERDIELAFGGISFDAPPDQDAADDEPDELDPDDADDPDGDEHDEGGEG